MGAGGSSIDPAEFETLKRKMTSIESSVNSLNSLKTQVDSLASAAAKQISYSDLALSITNNDTNKNALATAIASNPNKLGEALASSIGTNQTVIQSLQDKLGTNSTFQTAMADTLSSDKYKVKFQGPKGADGNIGDAGALKSNLFDQGRTMWCADGELCKIPKDKKGIDWGYGASKIIDDGELRIMSNDQIHFGIDGKTMARVDSEWGGLSVLNPDGRWTHFGHKNGGRNNWIRGDTQIDGTLFIPGAIDFAKGGSKISDRDGQLTLDTDDWVVLPSARLQLGAWQIDASDGHIRFRHNGELTYTMHNKNWEDGSMTARGSFKSDKWNKWI